LGQAKNLKGLSKPLATEATGGTLYSHPQRKRDENGATGPT